MKIFATNTNNYPQPQNILNKKKVSFKSLNRSTELKNLKGNHCACCGREMMSAEKLAGIWTKIVLPFSKIINSKKFEIIKETQPKVWSLLKEFADKYPRDPFDKFINDDINHGLLMQTIAESMPKGQDATVYKRGLQAEVKSKYFNILSKSRCQLKPAGAIMNGLKPIEKYLNERRLDVFQELLVFAKKYPEMELREIIRIPEIAERHVAGAYCDVMELADKRDFHLKNVEEMILKKCPEAEKDLKSVNTSVNLIYRHLSDPPKIIYYIKECYKKFLDSKNLTQIEKRVMKELDQLPGMFYTKNTFLAYARYYYTDNAIVNYMIHPITESEEHVEPLGSGGKNIVDNMIVMCRQCNKNRSNVPYEEFLKYHPEMVKNTLKQIQFVSKKILNGEINFDLKYYPFNISNILNKNTNGIINPDITEYLEKALIKSENNVLENKKQIDEIRAEKNLIKENFSEDGHERCKELQKIGSELFDKNISEYEFQKFAQQQLDEIYHKLHCHE